jgi:hypothetical protein
MKQKDSKNFSLRVCPQQFVVELANGFQLGPQFVVISQPPLDLRLLVGANGELTRPSSGITHGEDPDPMTFSPTALLATLAMEDPTIQQRTPHDLGRIGQLAEELLACLADLRFVHQYQ